MEEAFIMCLKMIGGLVRGDKRSGCYQRWGPESYRKTRASHPYQINILINGS